MVRVRLNILQKGLGLILIPLVLQVVFFAQFFMLIDKMEELNRAENRQSLIVENINKLTELFTIAWGTILTETLESNKIRAIDPEDYRRQSEDGLNKLKQGAPTPAFAQLIETVQDLAARQYDMLKEFSQTDPEESSVAIFAKYRKLKLTLRPYMKKAVYVNQALAVERDKLNLAQEQGRKYRESMKLQLFIGITLDIILTVALLVFLLNGITRRLAVLVRNARLLPSGEPLRAHVSGHDELTYLDQVLHLASADLAKAAEYRKSVMETMSHDLRSPIQSAMIAAEILQASALASESEKTTKQIEGLKRNLSRVVKLVEDNLTIDKLESGTAELEISHFDLHELAAEALDSVSAQAGAKSIELVNQVDKVIVQADRERILQVLANFLTNAVKFSPPSAPICVSSQNLGHSVKVMIADDGPGIDSEFQATIFDRFQQNAGDGKSRQGFGLGLAICKMLVQQHGGSVGVTSIPGKCSTFWFILPLKYSA